jgi:Flp pilus assembly protein TadG
MKKNPAYPSFPKVTERGTQLVELAIVVPIFVLLLAAVAEFGLYFYTYTTLNKATRVGARYLTGRVYTDVEKAKARNLVLCGSINTCASGSEVISGLTTSNIEITSTGDSSTIPETITVRIIDYNYQSLFDLGELTGGAPWQIIPVSPSITMRYMLEN